MFRLILSVIIVLISIGLCQQMIVRSMANQSIKIDYAELNHIRYGLFSINAWKKQIQVIMIDEINKLNLSHSNEAELKKHIEIQLDKLIDGVAKRIREANANSFSGSLKQSFIDTFVDMKDIKTGIPEYADVIMHEMTKEKTESNLKKLVTQRVEKYLEKTFDTQDMTLVNVILKNTDSPDVESARIKLGKELSVNHDFIYKATMALIILSIFLFAMEGLSRSPLSAPIYFLLIVSLAVLLVAGVTMPMIDMEAKLSQLSFVLLDHPIRFENQVLYFQSKSILDVFWVMISHKDLQMKLVGMLLVSFSVIFPFIKMVSSFIYFYNFKNARNNALVNFFVLKSGKWSMADVLVVAIFMAYIGFNGIITSQLGNLQVQGEDLMVLTTNGTSLQPGYFTFMTFATLGLFLSNFLTREKKGERDESSDHAL